MNYPHHRLQRNRKLLAASGTTLLATTFLLVGCSPAQDNEASGEAVGSSGVVEAATQVVDQYMGLPDFNAPGETIDVGSLAGKNVFFIPIGVNPFNQNIQDAAVEAGEAAGVEVTAYPNQGSTSEWVQGMNTAIATKADAIVLSGAPDPRALQPQIAEAEAAGIPVIVSHFYDDSDPVPPSCEGCENVAATVTAPFNLAGEVAANWMIADSGGAANVLLVGAGDVLPSDPTIAAMEAEFANSCPDCTTSVLRIPFADWSTKLQGEVQSALVADPNINYVYPLYDAGVAGAVPAIQSLGKTGGVKVVSYNGSPYALDMIRDGDIAAMNIGEDTVGIGYATMDQTFRIMLGQDPVEQRTPIRIWDDTNVAEAGVPAEVGVGFGTAFKDGFLKLWGLA